MNNLSKEQIEELKELGWTIEQIEKGYDLFICSGSSTIVQGALTIERIDVIDKFESDWEASRQAEKDGIKFINDIEGLEKGCYVDTPENRLLCLKAIKKHPELRVENLMNTDECSKEYWDIYNNYFSKSA